MSHDKKHQVLTLGRLGWALRQIEDDARASRDRERLSQGGGSAGAGTAFAAAVKTSEW